MSPRAGWRRESGAAKGRSDSSSRRRGAGRSVRIKIRTRRPESAREAPRGANVLCLLPDTGERYLSKFHSDEWMKEKRLLTLEKITLGLVAQLKEDDSTPHLVSVGPDQTVSDAVQLMNSYGLSQLPVLDEGRSVGSLREGKGRQQSGQDDARKLERSRPAEEGLDFPTS